MDKSKLKSYAPAARQEFIKAVTERANFFGLSQKHIEPVEVKSAIALIGGRAFSKDIAPQREALEQKIQQKGFDQLMEAVAYTWFNRLVALRYMEIHGYLDHGYRVLSHAKGGNIPEILEQATTVELTGLDRKKVVELKLDGTKDNELYKMLLIAQCNELNRAMPFLFERIQEETELLLPENLLHSNSLIQKLVKEIPEENWEEVEIIGWLYQFYISEKKDEVFDGLKKNKKITPQNIPAATQLFTPNWIVRYLVENSLGRLWMLNHPKSRLIEQMDYYIKSEQAETDFLHISKPEELKICDPACGSGHILVYAFDLLHAIYEEEGYEPAEIPERILTHNLYGIEIDERAGELAAFALTMKARGKQRRFFLKPVQPNICVLEKIQFEEAELKGYMDFVGRDLFTAPLQTTLHQFEEADNFGSLIRPEVTDVEDMLKILEAKDVSEQLFLSMAHHKVLKALRQADYLSPKYHVVIVNPPYMGGKGMNGRLGTWAQDNYPDTKADLFAMFMERGIELTIQTGYMGMINLPSWLFLSTYEKLRKYLIDNFVIESMLHMGRGIFGIDWGSTAFTLKKSPESWKQGHFFRLHKRNFQHIYFDDIAKIFLNAKNNHSYKYDFDEYRDEGGVNEICPESNENGLRIYYKCVTTEFKIIPGSPIAYWVSEKQFQCFVLFPQISEYAKSSNGVQTGNNELYVRVWSEISINKKNAKWYPYNKGGGFRKWYGNFEYLVNWENNGAAIKSEKNSCVRGEEFYFKQGITWSDVASGNPSGRLLPEGFLFDASGPSAFFSDSSLDYIGLALLNTKFTNFWSKILNPTLHFQSGDFRKLTLSQKYITDQTRALSKNLTLSAQKDWDSYETSWAFNSTPFLESHYKGLSLKSTFTQLRSHWEKTALEMQRLEEENNLILIDAYGLQEELTPEVPLNEITLTCNPHYRYSGDKSEEELEALLLADTMKELVSYALGCMMGRYSLDQPGLVYAHSGNAGFDHSKYKVFPADDDGIVPIMDLDWFPDDASVRFAEFLKVAWSPETLEENLRFVAESLSLKKGEIPRETIRRYLSTQFYKDHLKTYKKRPIYWLFSSGKEKAFQCLVYLHRYNESTLSRMRNEYVIPLQGKFSSRTEHLTNEVAAAEATSQRNKIQKQLDALKKKQSELARFDEELRHYADKRITLDLDDGVKINYRKFGNLLADVKAVTGKKE